MYQINQTQQQPYTPFLLLENANIVSNSSLRLTHTIQKNMEYSQNTSTNINIKFEPMNKLHEISKLKSNWGGYNESPINPEIIKIATNMLIELKREPEIFPVASGNITFEFYDAIDEDKCLIFQIFIDKVSIFSSTPAGEKCYDDIRVDDIDKMNEIIGTFYEQSCLR